MRQQNSTLVLPSLPRRLHTSTGSESPIGDTKRCALLPLAVLGAPPLIELSESNKSFGFERLPRSLLSLICAYMSAPDWQPFALTFRDPVFSLAPVRALMQAANHATALLSDSQLAREMLPFDGRYLSHIALSERHFDMYSRAVFAGCCLRDLPATWRCDPDVCLVAIQNDSSNWFFTAPELRFVPEFRLLAVQANGLVLANMHPHFSPSLMLSQAAVKQNPHAIAFVFPHYLEVDESLVRVAALFYQLLPQASASSGSLDSGSEQEAFISPALRAKTISMHCDSFLKFNFYTIENWFDVS
jgi:hypothetical protein